MLIIKQTTLRLSAKIEGRTKTIFEPSPIQWKWLKIIQRLNFWPGTYFCKISLTNTLLDETFTWHTKKPGTYGDMWDYHQTTIIELKDLARQYS